MLQPLIFQRGRVRNKVTGGGDTGGGDPGGGNPGGGTGDHMTLVNAAAARGYNMTTQEQSAWQTFFQNTSGQGVLQKLKFFLPFIGNAGNVTALEGLTGASVINWTGSVVHGGGVRGMGGYGVLNVNLVSLIGTPQNSHFGFYNKTAAVDNAEGGNSEIDFGMGNASGNQQLKLSASNSYYHQAAVGNGFVQAQWGGFGTFIEQQGVFIANRPNATMLKLHKNKDIIATNNNSDAAAFLTTNPYVLSFNNNGSAAATTTRALGCLWGGVALTDSEALFLNHEVQALMFGWNRNVL